MAKEDIKFWHDELVRVTDWVKLGDQKAAFLSAYYLAILGLILANKNYILQTNHNLLFWFLATTISISFIAGLFFIFKAIFPRLGNNSTDKSLFYYKHVAETKIVDFLKKSRNLKDSDKKDQLLEQIYTNSLIAEKKMENIKNGIKCLFLTLILLSVFLFII